VNNFKNKLLLQLIVLLILSYLIMISIIIVSDKLSSISQGKYILLSFLYFTFFFFKVGVLSIILCYIFDKIKKIKYILYLFPLIYLSLSLFFEQENISIYVILPVIVFLVILFIRQYQLKM